LGNTWGILLQAPPATLLLSTTEEELTKGAKIPGQKMEGVWMLKNVPLLRLI
jgi:hypothetical protein